MSVPVLTETHFSKSAFSSLLAQLAEEHNRDIASRVKVINQLQEQLASHAKRNVEISDAFAKAAESNADRTDVTEVDVMLEEEPAAAMTLSMDDLPEEMTVGSHFAEMLSETKVGKMCGFSSEKVHRCSEWWNSLREPQRPKYCGLRDFVDGYWFQSFIMVCIFANSIIIFLNADADLRNIMHEPNKYHATDKERIRLIVDATFTTIYAIELSLKLFVHRTFFVLVEDWRWNVFDAILVAFSIFDTTLTIVSLEEAADRPNLNFLRVLRIMKLTRIMRMLRAVRAVRELRLMLDCVVNSVMHLFWCVVLIAIVLLMFSLFFAQGVTGEVAAAHLDNLAQYDAFKADIEGIFDTLPHTMLHLFMATTGGTDWNKPYQLCLKAGNVYAIVFLFYIAFFCIVAWNIVMSTFVEKTFKLAIPDIEEIMMDNRKKDLIYSKELFGILRARLDENHNGQISLSEFKAHFSDPELNEWFEARDVDMKDAELFFRMLASVSKTQEVDLTTFVLGVMRLRGNASNIDVQALHYDVRTMHHKMHAHIERVSEHLESFQGKGPDASMLEQKNLTTV